VVLDRYHRRVLDRYARELGRFSTLPSNPPENALIQATPPIASRDGAALFEDIAGIWARSSILMHELLTIRGAIYLHVLQPNQYYATTRRFSEAEAATALSETSPYRRSVEQGYPLLVAAGQSQLQARRVRFLDATRALENYEKLLDLPQDPAARAETMRRLADLQLEIDEQGGSTLQESDQRLRRSIELYNTVLTDRPDAPHNDRVLYQLARAYQSLGDFAKAEEALLRMTREYPQSSYADDAHFRRAELLFRLEQFDDASAEYRKAMVGVLVERVLKRALLRLQGA